MFDISDVTLLFLCTFNHSIMRLQSLILLIVVHDHGRVGRQYWHPSAVPKKWDFTNDIEYGFHFSRTRVRVPTCASVLAPAQAHTPPVLWQPRRPWRRPAGPWCAYSGGPGKSTFIDQEQASAAACDPGTHNRGPKPVLTRCYRRCYQLTVQSPWVGRMPDEQ
jgi:hypothetical protein